MGLENVEVGDWVGKDNGRGWGNDPDGTIYEVLFVERHNSKTKMIFIARGMGVNPDQYLDDYYSDECIMFLKQCKVRIYCLPIYYGVDFHVVKKNNESSALAAYQPNDDGPDSQYKRDVKFFFPDLQLPYKKVGNSGLKFL